MRFTEFRNISKETYISYGDGEIFRNDTEDRQ
jgi:hypothetical protein